MIAVDHLRPGEIKASVNLRPGQRFGFHILWHSLSSLLITGQKADSKLRSNEGVARNAQEWKFM